MSIEPITAVDSYLTVPISQPPNDASETARADALLRAQQLAQVQENQAAATAVNNLNGVRNLNGVDNLTAGDQDFLNYLYGPDTLANVGANGAVQGQTPQFLLDLIDARQNGELPAGTEVTSSFVQGRYDAYLAATGTGPVQGGNPTLTTQELQDAQQYFNRRVAGAAVDLQV